MKKSKFAFKYSHPITRYPLLSFVAKICKKTISKAVWLIKQPFLGLTIRIAKLCTLFFTIVIFANSLEMILEKDIPYAYSMKSLHSSNYFYNANYGSGDQQNKLTSNYGAPKIIKLPSINKRLELINILKDDDKILVRTNKAHQMMDANGNIVIYLLKSWQTIDEPGLLATGDNIFLDSDKGWRYVYRIEEVNQSGLDTGLVLPTSENPQLLVLIEDSKNGVNYIIRGQYMTVINTQR